MKRQCSVLYWYHRLVMELFELNTKSTIQGVHGKMAIKWLLLYCVVQETTPRGGGKGKGVIDSLLLKAKLNFYEMEEYGYFLEWHTIKFSQCFARKYRAIWGRKSSFQQSLIEAFFTSTSSKFNYFKPLAYNLYRIFPDIRLTRNRYLK